ncbi:MAG: hypothetical protein Q7N95_17710, partial [Alphaproteobacteria bacterium]|nr:hypothetical protein [Alphaproteobacteria bacterium]
MFNKTTPFSFTAGAPGSHRRLALSTLALLGSTMLTQPAAAVSYTYGEVSGSIDTTVSAGASMRTSGRD